MTDTAAARRRSRAGARAAGEPADAGLTMVELLVALMVFLLVATSVLMVLLGALRLATDDRRRMTATSLATRELELVRDAFSSQIRGPKTIDVNQVINGSPLVGGTAGRPLVVDGIPYTVTRSAQWAPMGSTAASTCDEGGTVELAYLKVKAEVTWPELAARDRPPVTMDTILTPPKGTYSTTTGHIGVKVVDAAGDPVSGRSVRLVGPSVDLTESTAADGCALFAFLTPNNYTVTLSTPGYVNRAGDPNATTTASVLAGQLWRTTIDYDRSAALTVSFVTKPGHALPTANTAPVSLGNSALLPSGSKAFPGSGNTRVINNLWPYPAGYEVWAGGCLDNDPLMLADEDHPGAVRDQPATTPPGGTTAVAVSLAPLEVAGPNNVTITAVHAADTACPSGQTITLGTTNSAGKLLTSLPYGAWTIRRSATRQAPVTLIRGDLDQKVTVP